MQGRNVQLDLLRCAAILGVLVAHAIIFRPPMWWWDRLLTRPSWSGVDLFFVISGFLISGLLFSEFQKRKRINFGRFAIRRALKLYPTLYVLVFGILLYRLAGYGFQDWIIKPALHDLFFVQNYLRGTFPHFWSLAVEEHFYILLPVTLYVMLRKAAAGDADPFRRLPLIFLLVAALCLSARLVNAVYGPPYSVATHMWPTHLRIDSLLFGVLLSYWYRFHYVKFAAVIQRTRPFLFPAALLFILPAVILHPSNFFVYTFGLTSLYLGYGILMIALLQLTLPAKGLPGHLLWFLAYIGQHSYPIYVFHLVVMEALMRLNVLHGWLGLGIYFASTIVAGILVSKMIEFPVLRMRDRIFPPESAAEPSADVAHAEPASAPFSFPVAAGPTPLP